MKTNIRVLLVDDDATIRASFRNELEAAGITSVDEAPNGRDGLTLAIANTYDVILLDIDMPILSGIHALPSLKASQPEAAVIMLTDMPPEETLAASLSEQASGFLTKTSTVGSLATKVRQAAAGEQVFTKEPIETLTQFFVSAAKDTSEFQYFQDSVETLPSYLRKVFSMLIQGKSNAQIAHALNLSENTVRGYVTEILRATECTNRGEVAITAIRAGIER